MTDRRTVSSSWEKISAWTQRVVKAPFGRPTGMQWTVRLIADVLLPRVPAELALHVTTPDESTPALLGHISDPRLVAPAAAQQSTAVQTQGRSVAYPSSRAGDTEREIFLAVIGTVFEVHQVRFVRPLEIRASGPQPRRSSTATLRQSYQSCALVQRRQCSPSHPERWQSSPTDSHAARTRHTVTLAHALHSRADGAPASFAIVLPHQLASQPFRSLEDTLLHRLLAAVGPFSRKLLTEVYVLAAATPLPIIRAACSDPVVAGAIGELAPGTGPRDAVSDSGCRYCIHERRLATVD